MGPFSRAATGPELTLRRQKYRPAGPGGELWTATAEAVEALPADVPCPRLLDSTEWVSDEYAYRAELSSYVSAPVSSPSADLTRPITLPDTWWSSLLLACDAVAEAQIPTSPDLTILDREGFGPAPTVSTLPICSLPIPEQASKVRKTLASILATPEGWLAELTMAAIRLQAAERPPHPGARQSPAEVITPAASRFVLALIAPYWTASTSWKARGRLARNPCRPAL